MSEIASKGQLRLSFLRWALVSVPLILLLGMVSARISNSGYSNPWFLVLAKPSFMPPGNLFPIAWTILYVLMGIAVAIVLNARGARHRSAALWLFVAQLAVNLAWSPVFFALHKLSFAFFLIVTLIVLAALTAWRFFQIRKAAGLLMLPYLGWLLFAAALNLSIDHMNPNAEELAPADGTTQISI